MVAFAGCYFVFGDLGFVAYEGKVFEFGFGWGFWGFFFLNNYKI